MLARVSNIESFRRWREDDDQSVEELVRFITADEPSEAMLAGTAFHAAVEHAPYGEHETLSANGYTFHLRGGAIELGDMRELRAFGRYGDLTVTGQVDSVHGRIVWDHKTTARFDAERYLAGFQWRFYLDLFSADRFHWNVFEIREVEPLVYEVAEPQILTAFRYPGMSEDCARLAADYLAFARVHMPQNGPRADDGPKAPQTATPTACVHPEPVMVPQQAVETIPEKLADCARRLLRLAEEKEASNHRIEALQQAEDLWRAELPKNRADVERIASHARGVITGRLGMAEAIARVANDLSLAEADVRPRRAA